MPPDMEVNGTPEDRKAFLNGADNWNHYSNGGCSLIYDSDIAERLCCPSELKRNDSGRLPPNNFENWLDTQGRALGHAYFLIADFARKRG